MPRFEIDLDEKGDFVADKLPSEVLEAHKRIGIEAHGNGFRAGQSKAAEDAKKQLDEAIRSERARLEAQMPLEREKWQGIEAENSTLKKQLTDTLRDSNLTLTKREEAHAEEIMRRSEAIKKRNERIQSLHSANVRALAAQYGARDESLAELAVILQYHIGFDEDMNAFVKGDDGQPAKTNTGTPIAIDTFVKQYLADHPHHRKPAPGQGGGARGGASLHGGHAPVSEAAAVERYAQERSPASINDVFESTRRKAG